MLLRDKTVLIYGAGGTLGSAVARACATEGAHLFLAGRTLERIQAVADEITAAGGSVAASHAVDALDEAAVEAHVATITGQAAGIDVLFNAIGMQDVQGPGLLELPLEDIYRPVHIGVRSQLITARAVGRHMRNRGRGGVLMTVTAGPAREATAGIGGFGVACEAIEALWRNLAAELGPHGVRCVGVRSAGSPDAPDIRAMLAAHAHAEGVPLEDYLAGIGESALLKRLPLVAEVAAMVVVLASDRASAVTGTFVDVTCGSPAD